MEIDGSPAGTIKSRRKIQECRGILEFLIEKINILYQMEKVDSPNLSVHKSDLF